MKTQTSKNTHSGTRLKSRSDRGARAGKAAPHPRDESIIAGLRKDPEISHRDLARALNITETTVRNRLRRLENSNAMRMVTMINLSAAGFNLVAAVGVRVKERAPVDVAHDIARIDQVITVNLALGDQDLELQVIARNIAELTKLLDSVIANVRGVSKLTPSLGLKILKHEVVWVPLSSDHPARAYELPNLSGAIPVDELDMGIIEQLSGDARVSNRQIARKLRVNEGTIRTRRRRLLEEKVIRIAAVTNFARLHSPFVAFLWIEVSGANLVDAVAHALAGLPDITFVSTMIGRCDVLAITVVERSEDLTRYLHETLDKIPGVQRVQYTLSQSVIKYDPRWCSITD